MDDARRIYTELIECWNRRDAMGFADLFADHRPQPYVTIVREIRALTPDVTIVRAVAGRCELFQTTPAAFHGRADAGAKLTAELRDALKTKSAG